MDNSKAILSGDKFDLTILRLAHEVSENYHDWSNACIIGIQESGVRLTDLLVHHLNKLSKSKSIPTGKLDITFYRDDFRMRNKPLQAASTELDFDLENKRVILVDDVLYTGRTVQAAMSALQDFGRPTQVELLTLIDRRFLRHLPIQADYVGITVDAVDESYVKVMWSDTNEGHAVQLYSPLSQNSK